MTSVVARMVAFTFLYLDFSNENDIFISGLGCKRSLVQIQLPRPTYLYEITLLTLLNWVVSIPSNYAHLCSRMQVKAWDAGGKIGVRHQTYFDCSSMSKIDPKSIVTHPRNSKHIFHHWSGGFCGKD